MLLVDGQPGVDGGIGGDDGREVRVEQLDVTDPASVAALKAAIGDAPVDALLNNAGVFPVGGVDEAGSVMTRSSRQI